MSDNSREQALAQLASIKELVEAVNKSDDDTYDAALDAIHDDPLEISVRCASWSSPYDALEPDEYRILLCTGGPAVQIVGDLDDKMCDYGTPRLQHQDWFEDWQTLPLNKDDTETLLAYVRYFFPY